MVINRTTHVRVVNKVVHERKDRRIKIKNGEIKILLQKMGKSIGMCLPMSDKILRIKKVVDLSLNKV